MPQEFNPCQELRFALLGHGPIAPFSLDDRVAVNIWFTNSAPPLALREE
jgi:hypothetical protein